MTLAKIVAKVEATGDPVAVTRSGKRVAMVVAIDQFMEMHAALKEVTAENRAFLGRVEGAEGETSGFADSSTSEADLELTGAQLVAEHNGDWAAFRDARVR